MLGWLHTNRRGLAQCAGAAREPASRWLGLRFTIALIPLLLAGCEAQAPDVPSADSAAAEQTIAESLTAERAMAEPPTAQPLTAKRGATVRDAAEQAAAEPAPTGQAAPEQTAATQATASATAEQTAAPRATAEPATEKPATAVRVGVSDLAAAALAANCYTCHLTNDAHAGTSALATPATQAGNSDLTTTATQAATSALAKTDAQVVAQAVAQAKSPKAPAIPSLDGWQADEIRRALVRYQTEPDGQGVMHRIARALDAEAVGTLAKFIATHPCAGLPATCSEP